MLYLVQSFIHRPAEMSDEEWGDLARRESDYGIRLRHEGKLVHIWRVVGEYAAYSVWDAEDNDEAHRILSGLPLFPYVDLKVIPLATHPSTVRWNAILAGTGD